MLPNINMAMARRHEERTHPRRMARIRELRAGTIRIVAGCNAGLSGRYVRHEGDRIQIDAEINGVYGNPRWAWIRECEAA